jgi:hypothetical protein
MDAYSKLRPFNDIEECGCESVSSLFLVYRFTPNLIQKVRSIKAACQLPAICQRSGLLIIGGFMILKMTHQNIVHPVVACLM